MLLRKCEFCKNRPGDSQTLFMGRNEFPDALSHSSWQILGETRHRIFPLHVAGRLCGGRDEYCTVHYVTAILFLWRRSTTWPLIVRRCSCVPLHVWRFGRPLVLWQKWYRICYTSILLLPPLGHLSADSSPARRFCFGVLDVSSPWFIPTGLGTGYIIRWIRVSAMFCCISHFPPWI